MTVPGSRCSARVMRDIMRSVADRTLRFDMSEWFWGDAIAIDGLLDAADLLSEARFADRCHAWTARWADRFLERGPTFTDHLVPGRALVRLAQSRASSKLLDAARLLAIYLHEQVPRAYPSGAPLYRPDDPAYRHTVWVDTLYHEPPFFAALWKATGEAKYADMAVQVVQDHKKVLYDEKVKLLPQAVDVAVGTVRGLGWGRGHGWALLGLADAVTELPPGAREEVLPWTKELAERIQELQDNTGFWHTLLQDRESYLETSTATFMAAAYLLLERQGLQGFAGAGERALHAALSRIDQDGTVWGVSAVTWAATAPGADAHRYKIVPTEPNLWGQGSGLRMLAEVIRRSAR